jgi:hypothetical protein
MRRWFFAIFLGFAGCAATGSIQLVRTRGAPVAAQAVAILPVLHKFPAGSHEAFLRILPVCDVVLARGGLFVIGPDEVKLDPILLERPQEFASTGAPPAAARLGFDPQRTLALRARVEERVQRIAKARFDRTGRASGVARDVDVRVHMVLELLAPPDGEVIVRAVGELQEDPFAETPEHDRRPLITAHLRRMAEALLQVAAPRLKMGPAPPPPLTLQVLPSPEVAEQFRLPNAASIAEVTSRDPLLGPALREIYRRGLGAEVTEVELKVLSRAPAGVLVRADASPLERGDVIQSVGALPVMTPWALHRALHRSLGGTDLTVWRQGAVLRERCYACPSRVLA